MNRVAVELGYGDVHRWSLFDIWNQNANVWALMRNSSGLHTLVPERLQSSFSLLKMSDLLPCFASPLCGGLFYFFFLTPPAEGVSILEHDPPR